MACWWRKQHFGLPYKTVNLLTPQCPPLVRWDHADRDEIHWQGHPAFRNPQGSRGRLVSHRGVVFFVDQDINIEQQRELGSPIGELSGKPKSSKLHRHPISEETSDTGAKILERDRSSTPTLNHGEKSSELLKRRRSVSQRGKRTSTKKSVL